MQRSTQSNNNVKFNERIERLYEEAVEAYELKQKTDRLEKLIETQQELINAVLTLNMENNAQPLRTLLQTYANQPEKIAHIQHIITSDNDNYEKMRNLLLKTIDELDLTEVFLPRDMFSQQDASRTFTM
ncbi:MAG: hypothetical protein K0S11_1840 [Gammaproteobacteria bacterium]|jgi:uncharacterized protein YktA (UPF0223 family)|nr:hypothetical protein [Gammaproteobacteria bacterium]